MFQVLARRALIRYLLQEIRKARDRQPSIFVPLNPDNGGRLADVALQPTLTLSLGITFHFFCSHTPCGDASIFPMCEPFYDPSGQKRAALDDGRHDVSKRLKICFDDVHRTGAKCLTEETKQDTHSPGVKYHTVGAVRTKPGRGDRTLSVSCSDKLFRWHSSGIQVSTKEC